MGGVKRMYWLLLGYVLLGMPTSATGSSAVLVNAPTNLQGVAGSVSSINWTWDPSTGSTIIAYELHDDEHEIIATLPSSATSYLEGNLTENTQYSLHVHAVGLSETSPPSNSASRYTLVHTPVTGDFTVAVSGTSPTTIEITVAPPPNAFADQTAVHITRTSPTASDVLAFAPTYFASDSNLQPETQHCYNIQFRNGDGIQTAFAPSVLCATTGEQDHPCECKVKCMIDVEVDDVTFDPAGIPPGGIGAPALVNFATALLGEMSAANECIARHAGKQKVRDQLIRELQDGLISVRTGRAEAFTTSSLLPDGVKANCVVEGDEVSGPFGADVEIKLCAAIVRFMPRNPSPALSAHETGHVSISQDYFNRLVCPFIERCVKETLCTEYYSSTLEAENRTEVLVRRCFAELSRKFPLAPWQRRYDVYTLGLRFPTPAAVTRTIEEMREAASQRLSHVWPLEDTTSEWVRHASDADSSPGAELLCRTNCQVVRLGGVGLSRRL